jgi:DNA replication protein DnaC
MNRSAASAICWPARSARSRRARSSIKITIAKLPLAKDIGDFTFDGTPINETLVRDLIGGNFLAHQRNVVLVGGTGTGKSHLPIANARACTRNGARGRFFHVRRLVRDTRIDTDLFTAMVAI